MMQRMERPAIYGRVSVIISPFKVFAFQILCAFNRLFVIFFPMGKSLFQMEFCAYNSHSSMLLFPLHNSSMSQGLMNISCAREDKINGIHGLTENKMQIRCSDLIWLQLHQKIFKTQNIFRKTLSSTVDWKLFSAYPYFRVYREYFYPASNGLSVKESGTKGFKGLAGNTM